jgi:hypothetical protein
MLIMPRPNPGLAPIKTNSIIGDSQYQTEGVTDQFHANIFCLTVLAHIPQ